MDITNGLVLGEVNLTREGAETVGVANVGLYGRVGVVSLEERGEVPTGGVWGEGDRGGGVVLLTLLEASSRV